ncbi:related to MFS transporter [Phialocephala subalpina]|uniref:Related to MFS transporter n=1 Tax=Phialocephala subalpina TaxID=576137 RepID=A0A1L7XH62_9HELO|nr:related to MFS transporter [Phialocephala subalpina]
MSALSLENLPKVASRTPEVLEPEALPGDVSFVVSGSRNKLRTVAVLIALFLTLFIAALNNTIVATALPTICSQLHSASGYAWIGAAYLLASGASAPIWAKLSDIWGRKPILLLSVAMYFAASILCALAQTMMALIVGRVFQGAAGGGLIQLVNIVLSDMFSLRSRALYLGLLEVMWAIAGGVGPVIGGVFAQLLSWRWIFWINLPVSGTAFLLLLLVLDVHNPKTGIVEGVKAIDWAGCLSMLGFMVMLLLGLNLGGVEVPWSSAKVICLIATGSFLLVVFIFNEATLARHPIIPLKLFSNLSNVACLLVAFFHEFAVLANEYYLPLYFQSVDEASPVRSGVMLLPITLATALGGIATGFIIYKTGRYLEIIWIGMALFTIGNGLLVGLRANSSVALIIGFQLIAGLGAGLLFEPPLIALQAMTTQEDIATAVGTIGFIRSLSTSLAAVIGGIIFQNGMDLQAAKVQNIGLPPEVVQDLSGAIAAEKVSDIYTMVSDPRKLFLVKEVFVWSLRNIWITCTCMTFCGLLCSFFIKRKFLSNQHVESKTGLHKGSS